MVSLRTGPRAHERIGQMLAGRYRLLAPIGSGAHATVYIADDVRLGRKVAVKVLDEAVAHDGDRLMRFRDAAIAAASFTHPQIAALYDWGDGDPTFLVMEHLPGGSLRAMLDRIATLEASQVLVIALDAARALDHLHRRGVVHGDVVAENILFDDEGGMRLVDVGLAVALEPAATPDDATGDIFDLGIALIDAIDLERSGALGPVLEWATTADPHGRPDAAALGSALLGAARYLPRPAPLPIELAPTFDDITIVEGFAAPAVPTAPPPDDLTVIEEPNERPARRWGRHRIDLDESTTSDEVTPSHAGLIAAANPPVAARAARPGVYDFEQEDDRAFRDSTAPRQVPRRHRQRSPRARRRRGFVRRAVRVLTMMLVAVIVASLVLAVGTYPWQVEPAASSTVADFTNKPAADAEVVAAANGWEVVKGDTRADGTQPGEVVWQIPSAGESLDRGNALHLLVSLGPTLVDLPADLGGLSVDDARKKLADAGLVAGEVRKDPHDDVPVDRVIGLALDPPVAQLPKGTTVTIVASSGPAPRTVPWILTGRTRSSATQLLESMGVKVATTEAPSDTVAKGSVISHEPAAGKQVPKGGTVTLRISSGAAPQEDDAGERDGEHEKSADDASGDGGSTTSSTQRKG